MTKMKPMKIPFSPPDMSEEEAKEVREAILSGWITTGPRTKKLETQISEYVGTAKTVCLSSATASMEMVLHLLDIQPEDEVIVPAYTYTATASVTQHVGCQLVMVDSQKHNVEMDYEQLEQAITERTKVIMPVDIAGIVADYDRVYEIVERKKNLFRPANALQAKIGRIVVAADCAHAFGAVRKGKMAGAIADFSAFSFHAVKNFTTAEITQILIEMTYHVGPPFSCQQVEVATGNLMYLQKLYKTEWIYLRYEETTTESRINLTGKHLRV